MNPNELSVVLSARDDAVVEMGMSVVVVVVVEVMGDDGVLDMRDEKNDATLEATLELSNAEPAVVSAVVLGEEAKCSTAAANGEPVEEYKFCWKLLKCNSVVVVVANGEVAGNAVVVVVVVVDVDVDVELGVDDEVPMVAAAVVLVINFFNLRATVVLCH